MNRTEQADARYLWVEALRSGKYNQGFSALKHKKVDEGFAFCCLGVGCEIFPLGKWKDMEGSAVAYVSDDEEPGSENVGMPPESFLDLVGLSLKDAEELASANDSGTPFEEIADLIEEMEYCDA